MRKVYWRPKSVSRTGLGLISVVAISGLLLVENLKVVRQQPNYEQKMAAAELAAAAFESIGLQRITLEPAIDPSTDPAITGLVGLAMSSVTSISGDLVAKQTSVNPNFAAVIVEMLRDAGVKKGDTVAVGISGSFPALNICVYAAIETLEAKPVVIASAAASQWGANHPELLWIDMERLLAENAIFRTRSVAASIGGYEDRGLGLSEEGLAEIEQSIKDNGLRRLDSENFESAVEERLSIYREFAKGKKIKAYINVGGGTISNGRSIGKKMFKPGLNFKPPGRIKTVDGVMPRLISEGVPCIQMVQISQLAEAYGMPVPPVTIPEPGVATVFSATEYNKVLATIVLLVLSAMLYAFVRSDIGSRFLKFGSNRKRDAHPEPMV